MFFFFAVERPCVPLVPPCWELDIVLKHLMSSAYEPLGSLSLRALTKKTVFGCSCYVQKSWGLQALSCQVSFYGEDMYVSYLPLFVAKTDKPNAPLPRSFKVCSLRGVCRRPSGGFSTVPCSLPPCIFGKDVVGGFSRLTFVRFPSSTVSSNF